MTNPHCLPDLTLHVFEQDGGWHWALTIQRPRGTGRKVIAFSEHVFHSEAQALAEGKRAFERAHSAGLHRPALAQQKNSPNCAGHESCQDQDPI
jgi:hypothetical protein